MKSLQELRESINNSNIENVMAYLKKFNSILRGYGNWDKDIQKQEYANKTELTTSVRHWGDWSDEDDDEDEQVLNDQDYLKAKRKFEVYINDSPFAQKVIGTEVFTDEKCWLHFSVFLKKS